MVVTGNVFKHLIFGGASSADYGIYITGEAVYNAPTRAVEMVSVPGRNGDVPIDMGHWNNIEVTYTAGTFATTQAEFAEAVSNFRNAILPLMGYQRLEDTYNPNEYRLGVFTAGLDIEPSSKSKAGEFQITFNCKPQRWLKSGEAEITVSDGDTITNPTQYESQPLIEIDGAGTVALNDYIIEVEDIVLGDVIVAPAMSLESAGYRQISKNVNLENGLLNIGDSFMVLNVVWRDVINMVADLKATITGTATCTGIDGATAEVVADWEPSGISSAPWRPLQGAKITIPKMEFVFGTAKTYTLTATASGTRGPSSWNFTTTTTISYDGGSRIVYAWDTTSVGGNRLNAEVPATNGDSTVRPTDGEVIIDSETGDAYAIQGGTYISLNKYIQLGAQLPALKPGANVITYDDTITSLKITPRWWIL